MPYRAGNIVRYTNLYVKRRLIKLEIDIFGIITLFLKRKLSRFQALQQIKNQILDIAVQLKLSKAEVNRIWNRSWHQMQDLVKHTAYKIRKDQPEQIKNMIIYSHIRATVLNQSLIQDADQVAHMYEERLKGAQIQELLSNVHDSPFFLASAHPKPAKDHAAWEGKMYYDADWEQKMQNVPDEEKEAIRAYIRNHQLHTVQWVTGDEGKVWLVTRPNCKHFLRNIPVDEVLHSSTRKILKNHDLYMRDETPVSRRVITYRQYFNRLKLENALNELIPNKKLDLDMKHDRILLRKWA